MTYQVISWCIRNSWTSTKKQKHTQTVNLSRGWQPCRHSSHNFQLSFEVVATAIWYPVSNNSAPWHWPGKLAPMVPQSCFCWDCKMDFSNLIYKWIWHTAVMRSYLGRMVLHNMSMKQITRQLLGLSLDRAIKRPPPKRKRTSLSREFMEKSSLPHLSVRVGQ